ncbi:hypothetical protein KX729_07215 [Rhizobium sp. XQZ8]|uniref:hypothetical protein n=1 Tax=Rhizobium populisoli TaxID=2859785 RepID=UPI001CA5ADF2|nr:hypothetical protein [Rhizobium populisoli]MBW6421228.1 hypothetical protein [Rhizobium populisoli]
MRRLWCLFWLVAAQIALASTLAFSGQTGDRGSLPGLPRQELFSVASDIPEGFERREVKAGGTGFDFSTILPHGSNLVEGQPQPRTGVSALIYVPMRVTISIRHIEFDAYADAIAIARAYMRLTYDKVSDGFPIEEGAVPESNPAFALVAAGRIRDDGSYTRLARGAVISRGDHAIAVVAEFDYADYADLKPMLSRLFGGIRMQEDMSARDQIRIVSTEDGGRVAIPKRWQVDMLPDPQGGQTGFRLTMNGAGYPEFQVSRLDLSMEEARQHADRLMDETIARFKAGSGVKLSGESKRIMTPREAPGIALYQLTQRWVATEQDWPMITVLQVMRGVDGRIWQSFETSPDQSRYTKSGDTAFNAQMFNWSVASASVAAAIGQSIFRGPEAFLDNHSVRNVGH